MRVYKGPFWDLERIIAHPHRQFQHLTQIKATNMNNHLLSFYALFMVIALSTVKVGIPNKSNPPKHKAVIVDSDHNYAFVVAGSVSDDYPGEDRYHDENGYILTYVSGYQPQDTLYIHITN